jgi:hypothetical protein
METNMNKIRIVQDCVAMLIQNDHLEVGSAEILYDIMKENKIADFETVTLFIITSDQGTEHAKMDEIEKDTDNMLHLYTFELTPKEEEVLSTHAFAYFIQ